MNHRKLAIFRNGEVPSDCSRRIDEMPEFWHALRGFHRAIMHRAGGEQSRLGNEAWARQDTVLLEDNHSPAVVHRGALGIGKLLGIGELIVVTSHGPFGHPADGDVFRYSLTPRYIDASHNVLISQAGRALEQGDRDSLNSQDFATLVKQMWLGANLTAGATVASDFAPGAIY